MKTNSMYIKGFIPPHTLSCLDPSESILVALSGGADSSLLLQQLWLYSKEYGAKIFAAHLNHKIRGDDADRDEEFCRKTCARLGIEFFSKSVDIPSLAALSGQSLETAARNERYRFFYEIMRSRGIRILATAHNADDSLETQIFNFARGTGLRGLCGIPSVRHILNGTLVRPLIRCRKTDILTFCHQNGIEFVTDATNADTDYSRNRIRHLVIPELEKISPAVRENAERLAAISGEDEDFFDCEVEKILMNCGGEITARQLASLHPAISKRIIARICSEKAGISPEFCHLEAALELCRRYSKDARGDSSLSLPEKIRFTVSGEGKLGFSVDTREKARRSSEAEKTECVRIPVPGEGENICTVFGNFKITLRRLKNTEEGLKSFKSHLSDMNSALNIYNKSTYLLLKSDRIIGTLCVRKYLSGDSIFRGGISKAVRDIMREAGMPKDIRAQIPVFCCADDEKTVIALPFIVGAVRAGYGVMPCDIDSNTLIISVEDVFSA